MLTDRQTDPFMTEKIAKQIGSRQALISVGFGLLIAQIIMTYFNSLDESFIDAFFWFTTVKFKLNLLIGILIMFLSGHLFGQMSGKAILIKKRNCKLPQN
ncbi:hypothetical protein [Aurantibacillus circumpalustris]|uniref:hypothetical protein n=1 Tax=Aurantibacillus circumpalustris TaxID=3036359 RepID=UPI00295BA5B7|nr:hypothetical protein [Aurantibacillus circumpalustris]